MNQYPSHDHESNHSNGQDSFDDDRWAEGLTIEDRIALDQAQADGDALVEEIPKSKDALGWFSVICLLYNRMIGSGIFNASAVIFYNTQSVGLGLLFWFFGALLALSGTATYIELGLSTPRWLQPNGISIATPRSGGELPYLNYLLEKPRFLATCLFGVSFLVFGNTATNSVAFAVAVLKASNAELTSGKVVAIALTVNTFTCLLHSMSRRWGIRLNNLLGSLKFLMLIILIFLGFSRLSSVKDITKDNFTDAFAKTDKTPSGGYRYGEALVYAIFPFGGFHQANYVLAEIKNPHRNFARTSGIGVSLLCVLYMVFVILYAAIIPKAQLFKPNLDIAEEFFKSTIGRGSSDISRVKSAGQALRAFSAIGNVIVFTFTAARVKQEVAKEGILPFSKYIAASYRFSFRNGFQRLPPHQAGGFLHTEKSPAAALAVHWLVTTVLILAAVLGTGQDKSAGTFSHLPGYSLLLMAYAYGLDVIWFSCIGIGMLYLRFAPGSNWRHISPIPHVIGCVAAVIFTVTNLTPLIMMWVYDPVHKYMVHSDEKVPWFASQTLAVAIVVGAFLYWVGFRTYLYQKRSRSGLVWKVGRTPIFWRDRENLDENGQERLVQIYEIIRLTWTALTAPEPKAGQQQGYGMIEMDDIANFPGHGQDNTGGQFQQAHYGNQGHHGYH
ncbi:high-affinity methionine permease [Podospora fimiseda]|uniref:High-affinity methionine permease n=1 Tax=Podospora fimiseda TaxID=252190 RepID=A0AAN6YMH7_9PEZI|nr:high-affinity methionine permease [Podospora fimiseda]